MSGNAEFLNGLKKTTVAREKQFQSKIWGAIFLVGSGVAIFYASGNATQYPAFLRPHVYFIDLSPFSFRLYDSVDHLECCSRWVGQLVLLQQDDNSAH